MAGFTSGRTVRKFRERDLRVFLAPAVLVLVFVLAGCSKGRFPVQTEVMPYTDEEMAARESAKSARYRLRTGDQIKLAFKYETGLDQESVLVLPDGHISVEGLPTAVRAAGLTVDELNQDLTLKFSEDYRDPGLSVIVQKISDPEVYVLGEVVNPGLYKMPSNGVGVIQAISMAGGFTDDAKSSSTAVLRATDEGFMVRVLDLGHLDINGIQTMEYLDLQTYDIIYVPRTTIGDFAYYSKAIFGSALNITRFFWDIYALANIDKIDRIVR